MEIQEGGCRRAASWQSGCSICTGTGTGIVPVYVHHTNLCIISVSRERQTGRNNILGANENE